MVLKNKIDFLLVIVAENCNPNGDPLMGGRPRQDLEGYGEISDVCIKRKLRNRMQDMGHEILLKSEDKTDDEYKSIMKRVQGNKELWKTISAGNNEQASKTACDTWIDVRMFGQVIPAKKGAGVTIPIRGPVTIGMAKTLDIVEIKEYQISSSLNMNDTSDGRKDSSTLGRKYSIKKGVYIAKGSIFPSLAEKTGFSQEDADVLKESLKTMFENDASSARPSGSMAIDRLYWWTSKGECSLYPAAKVFRTLHFKSKEEYPYYEVTETPLDGLTPEVYQ